ncbi:MAG: 4-(cytidine 5'-diphospho)-2-C-methyl-D-erythritol kinase [Cellulosilyticaceae bacterium]
MNSIVLKAKAKINLTLDAIGKRENGYHDLRMIMQTVNLHDTISIKKIKTPGIKMNTNLHWLPKDEKNIAYKAAQLFLEESGIKSGVYINVYKRIPVAAGLAGGSTDAAAVLVGMNKLFETAYSKKKLMEMGVKLGADVPFCIMRGTVLAEGIGEVLTPLPALPYTYVVLAKPNISVSTASVYGGLRIDEIEMHPQTDDVVQAIKDQDMQFVINHMANVLEEVTIKMHPEIEKIKTDMLKFGAKGSMMSGSGPTVFGVFGDKEKALEAVAYFKANGLREVHLTSTFCPSKREGKGYARRNTKHKNK